MNSARSAALPLVVPGLILAALLAFLSKMLADAIGAGLPGLPKIPVSPVLCAVVLGMLWRNTLGVPRWATDGLNVAMKTVLRIGIALVGLRLTVAGAAAIAGTAIPVVLGCMTVALVLSVVVTRLFKVPARLGVLLAVGTAVCGATAVIAVAPVIRARGAETAFAITCVVLFGCTAMLCYPLLAAHFFGDSPLHAGVFLGTAIHDTSQVVGAGLIYSQQMHAPAALDAASVTKLLRNLSIALLVPAAAWWGRNQDSEASQIATEAAPKTRIVPFFVIAFIACIGLRTLGDAFVSHGALGADWNSAIHFAEKFSELCLICGMAGVGLSVAFRELWHIGWKPLAAGMLLAVAVGGCSLGLTSLMHHLAG